MSERTLQYNTAKPWQVIVFPISNAVQNLFMIMMMFSGYVAAGGYGIAVATAGLIVTYSRVFDAVTDPLIGFITDRMPAKWGKTRILMGSGYVIMALSSFAMFFWFVGTGLAVFTIIYMVYIIGYTIYNVGYQTSVAIITNNPSQRPKVTRYGAIYTSIVAALTSLYLSGYLAKKHGGLSMGAFQEVCITVVVASGILVVLAMIAISSKDTPQAFMNINTKPVKFKDMLRIIKGNRALQMLIVAGASDKIALQTASNTFISTMVFGIVIGNYAFSGRLNMLNLLVQIPLIFVATNLAGRKGIKEANIKWTTYSIIIALTMIIFMIAVDPKQISVAVIPTVLFIIINALHAATKMATSAVTGAMIPECADYELYLSGNYMPGVIATAYSFVDKLVSSLSATIAALGVSAIGYVTTTPQPGDPSNPKIFAMAMFLWMGMPIIGWVCTLIAMKWYPLTKEKMEEVQQYNREKLARTAAAVNE